MTVASAYRGSQRHASATETTALRAPTPGELAELASGDCRTLASFVGAPWGDCGSAKLRAVDAAPPTPSAAAPKVTAQFSREAEQRWVLFGPFDALQPDDFGGAVLGHALRASVALWRQLRQLLQWARGELEHHTRALWLAAVGQFPTYDEACRQAACRTARARHRRLLARPARDCDDALHGLLQLAAQAGLPTFLPADAAAELLRKHRGLLVSPAVAPPAPAPAPAPAARPPSALVAVLARDYGRALFRALLPHAHVLYLVGNRELWQAMKQHVAEGELQMVVRERLAWMPRRVLAHADGLRHGGLAQGLPLHRVGLPCRDVTFKNKNKRSDINGDRGQGSNAEPAEEPYPQHLGARRQHADPNEQEYGAVWPAAPFAAAAAPPGPLFDTLDGTSLCTRTLVEPVAYGARRRPTAMALPGSYPLALAAAHADAVPTARDHAAALAGDVTDDVPTSDAAADACRAREAAAAAAASCDAAEAAYAAEHRSRSALFAGCALQQKPPLSPEAADPEEAPRACRPLPRGYVDDAHNTLLDWHTPNGRQCHKAWDSVMHTMAVKRGATTPSAGESSPVQVYALTFAEDARRYWSALGPLRELHPRGCAASALHAARMRADIECSRAAVLLAAPEGDERAALMHGAAARQDFYADALFDVKSGAPCPPFHVTATADGPTTYRPRSSLVACLLYQQSLSDAPVFMLAPFYGAASHGGPHANACGDVRGNVQDTGCGSSTLCGDQLQAAVRAAAQRAKADIAAVAKVFQQASGDTECELLRAHWAAAMVLCMQAASGAAHAAWLAHASGVEIALFTPTGARRATAERFEDAAVAHGAAEDEARRQAVSEVRRCAKQPGAEPQWDAEAPRRSATEGDRGRTPCFGAHSEVLSGAVCEHETARDAVDSRCDETHACAAAASAALERAEARCAAADLADVFALALRATEHMDAAVAQLAMMTRALRGQSAFARHAVEGRPLPVRFLDDEEPEGLERLRPAALQTFYLGEPDTPRPQQDDGQPLEHGDGDAADLLCDLASAARAEGRRHERLDRTEITALLDRHALFGSEDALALVLAASRRDARSVNAVLHDASRPLAQRAYLDVLLQVLFGGAHFALDPFQADRNACDVAVRTGRACDAPPLAAERHAPRQEAARATQRHAQRQLRARLSFSAPCPSTAAADVDFRWERHADDSWAGRASCFNTATVATSVACLSRSAMLCARDKVHCEPPPRYSNRSYAYSDRPAEATACDTRAPRTMSDHRGPALAAGNGPPPAEWVGWGRRLKEAGARDAETAAHNRCFRSRFLLHGFVARVDDGQSLQTTTHRGVEEHPHSIKSCFQMSGRWNHDASKGEDSSSSLVKQALRGYCTALHPATSPDHRGGQNARARPGGAHEFRDRADAKLARLQIKWRLTGEGVKTVVVAEAGPLGLATERYEDTGDMVVRAVKPGSALEGQGLEGMALLLVTPNSTAAAAGRVMSADEVSDKLAQLAHTRPLQLTFAPALRCERQRGLPPVTRLGAAANVFGPALDSGPAVARMCASYFKHDLAAAASLASGPHPEALAVFSRNVASAAAVCDAALPAVAAAARGVAGRCDSATALLTLRPVEAGLAPPAHELLAMQASRLPDAELAATMRTYVESAKGFHIATSDMRRAVAAVLQATAETAQTDAARRRGEPWSPDPHAGSFADRMNTPAPFANLSARCSGPLAALLLRVDAELHDMLPPPAAAQARAHRAAQLAQAGCAVPRRALARAAVRCAAAEAAHPSAGGLLRRLVDDAGSRAFWLQQFDAGPGRGAAWAFVSGAAAPSALAGRAPSARHEVRLPAMRLDPATLPDAAGRDAAMIDHFVHDRTARLQEACDALGCPVHDGSPVRGGGGFEDAGARVRKHCTAARAQLRQRRAGAAARWPIAEAARHEDPDASLSGLEDTMAADSKAARPAARGAPALRLCMQAVVAVLAPAPGDDLQPFAAADRERLRRQGSPALVAMLDGACAAAPPRRRDRPAARRRVPRCRGEEDQAPPPAALAAADRLCGALCDGWAATAAAPAVVPLGVDCAADHSLCHAEHDASALLDLPGATVGCAGRRCGCRRTGQCDACQGSDRLLGIRAAYTVSPRGDAEHVLAPPGSAVLRTQRPCALRVPGAAADRGLRIFQLAACAVPVHTAGAAVFTQLRPLLEPRLRGDRLAHLHRQLQHGALGARAAPAALAELAWLRPRHFFDPRDAERVAAALAAALEEAPAQQQACDRVLRQACRALAKADAALGWARVGGISLAQLLEAAGAIACLDPGEVAQRAPPWLLAPELGVAAVVLALSPDALCAMQARAGAAPLRAAPGAATLSFELPRSSLRWWRQVSARWGWPSHGPVMDAQPRRLFQATRADRHEPAGTSLAAAPPDPAVAGLPVGPAVAAANARRAGQPGPPAPADDHALAPLAASRELSLLALAWRTGRSPGPRGAKRRAGAPPAPAPLDPAAALALRRLSALDSCGRANAFAVAAVTRGLPLRHGTCPLTQSSTLKLAERDLGSRELALVRHVLQQEPAALVFLDPSTRDDPEAALLALRGCREPLEAASALSALRPECLTPDMLAALHAAVFDGGGQVLAALPRVLVASDVASRRSCGAWRAQMLALLRTRAIASLDFFLQARFTEWVFHESAARGPTCPRVACGAAAAAPQPAGRRPRETCRDFLELLQGMPRDRLPLSVRGMLEAADRFVQAAARRGGLPPAQVRERFQNRADETYARCALALNDARFPEAPLQLPETLAAGRVHLLPLPRQTFERAMPAAAVARELAGRADGPSQWRLLHEQLQVGAVSERDYDHYTLGLSRRR